MLCCAAIAFVIGILRAAWFRLPGTRRPSEVAFAPVARWPAASEPPRPHPDQRATGPRPAEPPNPVAALLVSASAGTALYALSGYGLLLAGLVTARTASVPSWVLRDAVLGVAVVALLVAAARAPRTAHRATPRAVRGAALVGAGIAWWSLSLLDMHAFGLLQPAGGTAGDLLFHGVGAALVVAGAVLLARPARRAVVPPVLERSLRG